MVGYNINLKNWEIISDNSVQRGTGLTKLSKKGAKLLKRF